MRSKKDYYETLSIPRNADKDIINKAYRKLALKYHPDRNKDDPKLAEKKFKEVTEAYQILSDPTQRNAYDRFGHAGLKGASSSEGFGGFSGFGGVGDIFSEVFGDIFGTSAGERSAGPHQGSDLKLEITIDFLDAVFGAEKTVTVNKQQSCQKCKGSGADPSMSTTTCRKCQGSGQVFFRQGFFNISKTCDMCRGEGVTIEKPCTSCHGKGLVNKQSKLKIKIPAGIRSGQKLRMTGEGGPGQRGGPSGDLYVEVQVEEHALFKRDEDDIRLEVPLTFLQATLGDEIPVPTLHGNVKMKIPPGTQPGKRFRLKGKGVPHVEGYHFGDQIVTVIVEIPSHLDKEQKKLLQKFMSSMDQKNHPLAEDFLKKVSNSFKK